MLQPRLGGKVLQVKVENEGSLVRALCWRYATSSLLPLTMENPLAGSWAPLVQEGPGGTLRALFAFWWPPFIQESQDHRTV